MCAYDTVLDEVTDSPDSESFEQRAARRSSRWEHALPHLPTAKLIVVAVISFIFLTTSFYPLHHTDLWGHLTYGRWIAENGTLPDTDPLALAGAAEAGAPQAMVHVSWLAQVAGYKLWQVAGSAGLQLAHVFLIVAASIALMAAIRCRSTSIAWAAAGALVAYLLSLPIAGVIRPQLFAMLAMAMTLLAISQMKDRWHPLVWLPVVFALWANLHGSFPVGMVVVGCFLVSEAFDAVRRGGVAAAWRCQAVRRAVLLLGLITVAVTINPHGMGLLVHVLAFGQHGNLHNIQEWQPTVLKSLTGGLFFGSLLITGVLLRISPRRVTAADALLLIVFGIGTLLAMRMLVWWAMIWPVLMIPHVAAVCREWLDRSEHNSKPLALPAAGTAMNTLIAVAVLFMTLVVSPMGDAWVTGQRRSEAVVVSKETPVFLADEIGRLGLTGKIFAPMKWSDYLLWHAEGAVTPLISSHVHLVSPETWHDYLSLDNGHDSWAEILKRHGIEYLVVDNATQGRLIRQIRDRSPEDNHRVLYQDQRGQIIQVISSPDVVESEVAEVEAAGVKETEQRLNSVEPAVKPVKQVETALPLEPNSSNNA